MCSWQCVKESDRQRETEGGGGAERESATESGYVYVRMAYSYGILVYKCPSLGYVLVVFFLPKKTK